MSQKPARLIRTERRGPAHTPQLVLDAKARAAQLLAAAELEAERLRERAEAVGHAKGLARAAEHCLELAAQHERRLANTEAELLATALRVASQLVHDSLHSAPERIVTMVGAELTRLRSARRLQVRVHPDDAATLRPILERLCARAGLSASATLTADDSLSRGDCVLLSDVGNVDAKIETQLDSLAQLLAEGAP